MVLIGTGKQATETEFELVNPYDSNDEIQEESDNILDFTEVNPFGEV